MLCLFYFLLRFCWCRYKGSMKKRNHGILATLQYKPLYNIWILAAVKNGVKKIQALAYNGAHTVCYGDYSDVLFIIEWYRCIHKKLLIFKLNKEKKCFWKGNWTHRTLQISEKQGKLDLNAITILPSRILMQERVKLVMWRKNTPFSLLK